MRSAKKIPQLKTAGNFSQREKEVKMKLRNLLEYTKWYLWSLVMTKYIFWTYKYELTCQQIRGAILNLRFQIYLLGRRSWK
jgi:hypothetical protein